MTDFLISAMYDIFTRLLLALTGFMIIVFGLIMPRRTINAIENMAKAAKQ